MTSEEKRIREIQSIAREVTEQVIKKLDILLEINTINDQKRLTIKVALYPNILIEENYWIDELINQ